MFTKKYSRMAAGVAILATSTMFLLAGCASSGKEASSASGTTTIQVVLWPGPEGDAMQVVAKQYNAGQGKTDHVKVKTVLISRDDTFTKEATEMAAKSSDMDVYFTASYLATQHAPYLDTLKGVIKTDKYFKQAVNAFTIGGQLKAVPMDVSQQALFYRKDLIGALLSDKSTWNTYGDISLKVTGERLKPKDPKDWSWQDYLAMAAYFTRSLNPASPTEFGTEIPAKNTPFNTMFWNNVLWGEGGNWLKDGKPSLNSSAAKKAMALYQTMFSEKLVPASSAVAGFPEMQAAMQSGSVAFLHQWTSGYATLNDPQQSPKTAGKLAVAPVPGQKAHVHFLGAGLNKYSKHKNEALKFLTYLAGTKAQTTYVKAGGVPSVPSILKAQSEKSPILGFVSDFVAKYGFVEPNIKGVSQYQLFVGLGQALSAGWVNNVSADTALKAGQDILAKAAATSK